ncbi:hypothetical protein [Streptomyces varsoviensis]|nr:hypothetical protein [Streptomyces varsoviensis]
MDSRRATRSAGSRSFLENSPFTDEQKADIGHRNGERRTARAKRPSA